MGGCPGPVARKVGAARRASAYKPPAQPTCTGTAEAEMLAVAGLLVALRVGACPDGHPIKENQNQFGTYAICEGLLPLNPSEMASEEWLCKASNQAHTCCIADWSNADNAGGAAHCWNQYPNFDFTMHWPVCDSTDVQTKEVGDSIYVSVDCTSADDSGLSTGAIAGIAVGAVAFVGLIAAAAVCL